MPRVQTERVRAGSVPSPWNNTQTAAFARMNATVTNGVRMVGLSSLYGNMCGSYFRLSPFAARGKLHRYPAGHRHARVWTTVFHSGQRGSPGLRPAAATPHFFAGPFR